MTANGSAPSPLVSGAGRVWAVILTAGLLQCGVYAAGTFFFDFFAGTATRGFGVMGEVGGTGMFFVYMIGYLNALLVVLPILLIRRFGVGLAVYLPYAIVGFPVEYYFEVYREPVLRGVWAVAGWCAVGLLTGAAADATFVALRNRVSDRWLALSCGAAVGSASFVLTVVALAAFYKTPLATNSGSFIGVAYFGVPWLLVHSMLGAYTAHALSREK
jgi:hypothetical protein